MTMRAIDLSWCEQLGDKSFEAFAHVLSGGSSWPSVLSRSSLAEAGAARG